MSRRRIPEPVQEPETMADILDPEAVARGQIMAHLGGRPADSRRLHTAITRHTTAVTAVGGAVELDWYTLQLLSPSRGMG